MCLFLLLGSLNRRQITSIWGWKLEVSNQKTLNIQARNRKLLQKWKILGAELSPLAPVRFLLIKNYINIDRLYWHCITCPAEPYAASADMAKKIKASHALMSWTWVLHVSYHAVDLYWPILTEWRAGPEHWIFLSINYFMILYNTW